MAAAAIENAPGPASPIKPKPIADSDMAPSPAVAEKKASSPAWIQGMRNRRKREAEQKTGEEEP